ncbi:MAG: single-stranded DNA-binding protein [Saprospiraceae bacterium]|nr:single-stranded DNA-binding protein [Saprospiraceae bacterium]
MNTLKNAVQLIGNLGRDVEVIEFDSGNKKATFSLATTESYKNNKGEQVKTTQWHNIIAWGKNAELMAKSLVKGSKVAVQGMISYRNFADKSGSNRQVTEIVVSEFMKIGDNLKGVQEPKPF